jgi:hypothetical protein
LTPRLISNKIYQQYFDAQLNKKMNIQTPCYEDIKNRVLNSEKNLGIKDIQIIKEQPFTKNGSLYLRGIFYRYELNSKIQVFNLKFIIWSSPFQLIRLHK